MTLAFFLKFRYKTIINAIFNTDVPEMTESNGLHINISKNVAIFFIPDKKTVKIDENLLRIYGDTNQFFYKPNVFALHQWQRFNMESTY